jgi:predicted PurR-regulated permease PerM
VISLIVSTVAYFVAAYYIKRYLDDSGIPRTFTRSVVVLVLALAIAYGVAALVELIIPDRTETNPTKLISMPTRYLSGAGPIASVSAAHRSERHE